MYTTLESYVNIFISNDTNSDKQFTRFKCWADFLSNVFFHRKIFVFLCSSVCLFTFGVAMNSSPHILSMLSIYALISLLNIIRRTCKTTFFYNFIQNFLFFSFPANTVQIYRTDLYVPAWLGVFFSCKKQVMPIKKHSPPNSVSKDRVAIGTDRRFWISKPVTMAEPRSNMAVNLRQHVKDRKH